MPQNFTRCHDLQGHRDSSITSLLRQSEELELQYKSCYARILDSKRRFLEAATRYYELSQVGGRSAAGEQVCLTYFALRFWDVGFNVCAPTGCRRSAAAARPASRRAPWPPYQVCHILL